MKIYQALLLLLLPLTSNSQACDVCDGSGDFDPDKQINATATCADLGVPDDVENVDAFTCTFLTLGVVLSGCCSGGSNVDCTICGDGTLTNPEFTVEIDDPETESATCGEYDKTLILLGALGLDEEVCAQTAAGAQLAGCECEGSPAAHANVKIASLVFVGVTFMASFF
jgi:hypothetical protein